MNVLCRRYWIFLVIVYFVALAVAGNVFLFTGVEKCVFLDASSSFPGLNTSSGRNLVVGNNHCTGRTYANKSVVHHALKPLLTPIRLHTCFGGLMVQT